MPISPKDRVTWIRLLRTDVEDFNREWGQLPAPQGIDLTGADLRGADLKGVVLVGANLAGANLEGCQLDQASLSRADLTRARLRGANLFATLAEGADFTEADLSEANIEVANLNESTVERARLDRATIDASSVQRLKGARASFAGATLEKLAFLGCKLSEADFEGATLDNVEFWDTELARAKFTGATARGLTFERSDLTGVNLGELRGDEPTFVGENTGVGVRLRARSVAEEHLYMALHPCACGHPVAPGSLGHSLWFEGNDNISVFQGKCAGCQRTLRLEFAVPADAPQPPRLGGAAPSQIIDPGEFYLESDRAILRGDVARAIACLEEILKFIPPGGGEVPASAFTGRGAEVRSKSPLRFERELLEARLGAYHTP